MNASLTFDLVRRHMPRAIGVGNPATASLGRGARGGRIKPSRALDQISGWQAIVRAIAAILALCFAAFSFAASLNPDPASKWSGWQSGPAAVNTPELRDGRVYKLSPAQIIYYSAKENGLNPLLLLVKLQAEQGLIKNSYSDTELQRRLDRAVGYGVLESNPTATKWFGFYPQLVGMSYEFSQMRKKKDFHAAFLEYTPHEDKYKELQTIYAQYAVVMNRVSGRHYSASPGSSGYLDDFRDVSAQHIQAFLGEFPGALKNASLFSGSAPASSGGAGATVGTDGMQFVSETLPDGSVVQGGAAVAKSWTLRNAGSKPWDANYCLRPSGANAILGAANVCVNGVVAPGATFVFSTTLRIPSAQATEQTLRQSWRFTDPAGTQVGSEIWAQVKVAAVSVGGSGPGSNPGSSPTAVAMPLSPMPGASQSFAHSLNYKTSACNFVGLHTGVDYAPVSVGQAVFAIADGTVSKTGQIGKTANSLGSYVVVDHPQLGIRSYYLHIVPGVSAGAKVSAGARIASIANTTAVGKHLHLEIQKGGFNVLDSNGKAKLFVGHSTTPIGQCGYVTRQSDLAKGWVNPAEFLKHPVSIGGTGQHQPDHEDVDEEDFPPTSDQKRRADVVAMLLNSLAAKGHKFAGSLDDQARAAGLITSTTLARPQDTASRMEVALFAYRALQKFAPTALTGAPGNFPIEEFRDAPDGTAAEYQRVVNALAGAAVVTGSRDANGEMRFYPTRKASTAEVQAFVDRTVAKIAGGVTTPAPAALNIVGAGVSPTNVALGQQMTFSVQVDNPAAVDRAELVFGDTNVAPEVLVRNGSTNTWSRSRMMTQAGTNRPFQIRVYKNGGGTVVRDGTYSVQASTPPPAATRLRDEVPPSVECPVRGDGWSRSNSSPAHKVGGGIGGADDSNALDLNQNASSFNADAGQAVYAVADGDVYSGNGWGGNSYGQLLINHTDAEGRRWSSGYLHMTNKTTASRVNRGDVIGRVGRVGADNDHLHFAVYTGHDGRTSINRIPTCNWAGAANPGDAMQFVGETLPDNSFISASVVTPKSWTLRNTGSTTWTSAYCLRPNGAQPLGSSSVCVTGNVPPNTTHVFQVNLQAPAAQATEQVYRQEWALRNASNTQIGTAVYALVKVRGASSSTPPSPPIPAVLNIQSIGVSPQSAQAGHQMTFQVAVDNGATVQRVELVFPDAGVTEAMTQAGANNWQRSRVMAQSGSNRPYRINVIKKDGTTVTRDGTYSVTAVPAVPTPPPPPAPIVVNIQSVSASPSSVTVGQTMTFSTSVDNPGNVQKVELRFPDVGVVEAMTQSGSMWVRSRTMTQAGGNRSFQVVVTKRDGQTVTRDGGYSVASAPVAPPAPPSPPPPSPPVAPPSAPPASGGEVPPAAGCTAGGVKMCGVDGRTYANACTLMKYGVSKARNGPC